MIGLGLGLGLGLEFEPLTLPIPLVAPPVAGSVGACRGWGLLGLLFPLNPAARARTLTPPLLLVLLLVALVELGGLVLLVVLLFRCDGWSPAVAVGETPLDDDEDEDDTGPFWGVAGLRGGDKRGGDKRGLT